MLQCATPHKAATLLALHSGELYQAVLSCMTLRRAPKYAVLVLRRALSCAVLREPHVKRHMFLWRRALACARAPQVCNDLRHRFLQVALAGELGDPSFVVREQLGKAVDKVHSIKLQVWHLGLAHEVHQP